MVSKTGKRPQRKRRTQRKRKAPTNRTLAKRIKFVENNLIELKWRDGFATAIQPWGWSPNLGSQVNTHFTPIAQGDQPYERNGDMIHTTSFQVRFSVYCPRGERSNTYLRVIIFWDRQPNMANNGLFTSGGDNTALLEDASTTAPLYLAPINYLAIDRYDILYDKTYRMDTLSRASNSNPAPPGVQDEISAFNQGLIKHIKVRTSRKVKYGNANAGYPVTNALHVAWISNIASSINEAPIVTYCARLYYKDA